MLIKKKQTTNEQIENLATHLNEKEMLVVRGGEGDEEPGSGEGGGDNVTVGDDGPG